MLMSMIQNIIDQLTIAKNMKLIHSAAMRTESMPTGSRIDLSIIISDSTSETVMMRLHDYFKAKFPKAVIYTNGRVFALTLHDQITHNAPQSVNI